MKRKRKLKPWEVLGDDGLPLQMQLDFDYLATLPDPVDVNTSACMSLGPPSTVGELAYHAILLSSKCMLMNMGKIVPRSLPPSEFPEWRDKVSKALKLFIKMLKKAGRAQCSITFRRSLSRNSKENTAMAKYLSELNGGAARNEQLEMYCIKKWNEDTIIYAVRRRRFVRRYEMEVFTVLARATFTEVETFCKAVEAEDLHLALQAPFMNPIVRYSDLYHFQKVMSEDDAMKTYAGINYEKFLEAPAYHNHTGLFDYASKSQLRDKWEIAGWIAIKTLWLNDNLRIHVRGFTVYKLSDKRYRVEYNNMDNNNFSDFTQTPSEYQLDSRSRLVLEPGNVLFSSIMDAHSRDLNAEATRIEAFTWLRNNPTSSMVDFFGSVNLKVIDPESRYSCRVVAEVKLSDPTVLMFAASRLTEDMLKR